MGDVDLKALSPVGYFNTAVWTNDGAAFRNEGQNHAVYEAPLSFEGAGRIIAISIVVETSNSNAVSVSMGDASTDCLTLECQEGAWEISCNERHTFADPIPPLQSAGTHTNEIRFVMNRDGRAYEPLVTTYDNGVPSSANNLAPSPSQWKRVGDVSSFTHVRVALHGDSAIRSIRCARSEPPSLILIR